MITLSPTDSLSAVAGTATAITYTILGDAITSSGDAFKVLAQNQLPNSVGSVIAATAGQQSLIKTILLSNTTGSTVFGVKFFINGTTDSHQIISMQIPANGSAVYESGTGWRVYDSNGGLATSSIQGQQGIQGVQGVVGPTQVFNGIATLNFGAAPGTNLTTVTVTGQTNILSTSTVSIFIMADSTVSHNAIEHQLIPIKLSSSIPINGTGFIITGISDWRLTGTFSVRWAWNN